MLYPTAQDWRAAPRRKVLVFGMSGLGKTHLSGLLRASGGWFHYSIDYRIGTRYMGEAIVDSCLAAAMSHPYLKEMLINDAIYIAPNVHTHDLTAVATFLGKPGSPQKGGLPMAEYATRQEAFRLAEIAALNDTPHFAERAKALYGYDHFICDTGGSICEWVDPENPDDPLLNTLSEECLLVWIRGDEAHTQELIRRFDRAPKPMAYQPAFLARVWTDYLNENKCTADEVDPDAFVRWTYAQALSHRQPRYEAMAKWGVTITPDQIGGLKSEADFVELIAGCLSDG
ncbi:ATPase [Sulfitobacter sp. EhC04]|uniref:ATPase n=1 Tax=Sulfitobacter sp. EhC04 TaxID=1849168 RepID=UPI0007F48581|nr:ATPase [Sulfitobacter sp. EhC04]OAN74653.1 ATPase [Sulfitobacter sp. EhC04]